MFVRFREVKAERLKRGSAYAFARRECAGKCKDRPRWYPRYGPDSVGFPVRSHLFLEGCPLRPLCPLRIGPATPYRLDVSLIETRRENGKVRQEHVANLGSIAGEVLPAFWAGMSEEEISRHRPDFWHKWAPLERRWFWKRCEERLARLANRIGPGIDRIRQVIAKRIPPFTPEDEAKLEAWEWEHLQGGWNNYVESAMKSAAGWRAIAAADERKASKARAFAQAVKTARSEGKTQAEVKHLHDLLGRRLAGRIRESIDDEDGW